MCDRLSWPPCRRWPETLVSVDWYPFISLAVMGANVGKLYPLQNHPSVSYLQQRRVVFPADERYPRLMCTCWYAPPCPLCNLSTMFLLENNLPLLIRNQTLLTHNQKGELKIWDELWTWSAECLFSNGIVRVSGSIRSEHKTAALNSNNLLIAIVKLAVLISDKLGF